MSKPDHIVNRTAAPVAKPAVRRPWMGHELTAPDLLTAALNELVSRDDGWLRIVPQDWGRVTFYKWKFTSGRFDGHYVMWRDTDHDPAASLAGLVCRILEAYGGVHKPVLDRVYEP